MKNITSSDVYAVPLTLIRSHFDIYYCCTCHSVQGSSINEAITIYVY